jgi:hypothetical protein
MNITVAGPSSSTERSRHHRKRRRLRTRCIIVDVSQLEIAALVQKGYLPEEAKHDTKAIKGAIEGVISDMVLDLKLV